MKEKSERKSGIATLSYVLILLLSIISIFYVASSICESSPPPDYANMEVTVLHHSSKKFVGICVLNLITEYDPPYEQYNTNYSYQINNCPENISLPRILNYPNRTFAVVTKQGYHSISWEIQQYSQGDVLSYTLFLTPLNPSKFTDKYYEEKIDKNSDGLAECLNISIEININLSDTYILKGKVVNETLYTFSSFVKNNYFEPGTHVINVSINGIEIYRHKQNTRFRLMTLSLENSTGFEMDFRENPYNTSKYTHTEFQHPEVYFTGTSGEELVDSNGNGFYDYLIIKPQLFSSKTATYTTSGDLYKEDGTFITHLTNTTLLIIGTNTVNLNTDGEIISNLQYSGKYVLRNLSVYEESELLMDLWIEPYTTFFYDYTQFEIPPTNFVSFSDYGTDVDDNEKYEYLTVDVNININQPGVYTLIGYLSDIDGLLTFANTTSFLDTRMQTLTLNFDGWHIYQAMKFNATYVLGVKLYNGNNVVVLDEDSVYTTHQYNYTEFERPLVLIQSISSDYGIDINNDEYYDYLAIDVALDAEMSGDYTIIGYLCDNYGEFITSANSQIQLENGVQTARLDFNGKAIRMHKVSGNYTITIIEIYDSSDNLVGSRRIDYATSQYDYSQFQPPSAYLTSSYNDFGIDINGNGLYGYLSINVSVNVTTTGNYTVELSLYSQDDYYIVKNSTTTYLNIGTQTVSIRLSGQNILLKEKNGPYIVSYVKLTDEDDNTLDFVTEPYTTKSYNYTDFEEFETLPISKSYWENTWLIILVVLVVVAIAVISILFVIRKRVG